MELLGIIFLGIIFIIGCSVIGLICKALWFVFELILEGSEGCFGCLGAIIFIILGFIMLGSLILG
jgi:hypothetical protein